jgi:hypothetical protein
MHARFHARFDVHRSEMGRLGQDGHVHAAGQQTPVAVKTVKATIFVHVNPVAQSLAERLASGFHTVCESVGHGGQFGTRMNGQRTDHRTRSAAATANQPNFQHIAPGRVSGSIDGQPGGH